MEIATRIGHPLIRPIQIDNRLTATLGAKHQCQSGFRLIAVGRDELKAAVDWRNNALPSERADYIRPGSKMIRRRNHRGLRISEFRTFNTIMRVEGPAGDQGYAVC